MGEDKPMEQPLFIRRVLVAVDFSDCSRVAMQTACRMLNGKPEELIVLHVIDQDCVNFCIENELGGREDILKRLHRNLKSKLEDFIEGGLGAGLKTNAVVCQGAPYLEINRQADRFDVDLIVLGSCGMVGDPSAIFFGGTTEKVQRFIKRPVLCVPPGWGGRTDARQPDR
ncbi:MAG: universal stress protein [Desulfobacterales bacterium]